jgi:hypothetical protein
MMSVLRKLWGFSRNGTQEPENDAWIEKTLASLDPAVRDPRYWFEFHRGVMLQAGGELARRRRLAEVTVSDVVFSWSRALVPAAAAASLAAFLMLRPAVVETPAPIRLEEILWEGADVSATEASEELAVEISFTVDVY